MDQRPFTRRSWLQFGGLASLLGLQSLAKAHGAADGSDAAGRPGFGRAKSVILVYTSGGQSQLETWDPKPLAPREIRGAFDSIPTAVPGTIINEHLPRLATLTDRLAIIRSVSHDDLDHGSAAYLALTGRFHPIKTSNPPVSPDDFPTYGSVLRRVRPASRHHSQLPYDAVHVNGPALVPELIGPGQDAGFLGRDFNPLLLGDVHSAPVAVPCLDQQADLPARRLAARRGLRETLQLSAEATAEASVKLSRSERNLETAYQQAYDLLASPRSRQAFDLSLEPQAVRDRYGRHRSGQACLMARRLVEAGVPFINVIWNHSNRGQDKSNDPEEFGWDTHNDIFETMQGHLLPKFDQSFSALLEDLDERGLLDETLVVCMGEFGRAPLVAREKRFAGSTPGRKHWASVYSIVMAGAGVVPGAIYGASDSIGGQPQANRVVPGDIAATMFSALGIDSQGHFEDAFGRPYAICTGKPIDGLYRG